MNKSTFSLCTFVLLVTGANIYMWFDIMQAGTVHRSGKMFSLIVILGLAAIFSDKFSRKRYAPELIRVGSLIGMTALFFILYNR